MFRKMRRHKQALSKDECVDIIINEPRGVLALTGDYNYPYTIPMSHVYVDGKIYFHGAKKGHKIDAINADNKVSFCVYDEGFRKDGEWALNISSVIVFGKICIVEDLEKSIEIFRRLSLKFTSDIEYIDSEIQKFAKDTLCYELRPEHITGKMVNES